jgi:predicted DNA-binding transcriptional regulator AlpA
MKERETLAASGYGSRSTLREMIREGRFPSPIRISPGRVAWSAAEIAAWQQARIQDRDAMQKSQAQNQAQSACSNHKPKK